MKTIKQAVVDQAMSYEDLRQLMAVLHEQNKTTGHHQSEALLHYSKLNETRMKRLDKTIKLQQRTIDAIQGIDQPLTWLVITEGWCGDAAQVVPVLEKMAALNDNIDLKFILRDDNPEIMDAFLTNGGRSIPKLILLKKDTNEVLGDWGPRPAELQQMVMDAKQTTQQMVDKSEIKVYMEEVKKNVQKWYIKDKTIKIQAELIQYIQGILEPIEA